MLFTACKSRNCPAKRFCFRYMAKTGPSGVYATFRPLNDYRVFIDIKFYDSKNWPDTDKEEISVSACPYFWRMDPATEAMNRK